MDMCLLRMEMVIIRLFTSNMFCNEIMKIYFYFLHLGFIFSCTFLCQGCFFQMNTLCQVISGSYCIFIALNVLF